jgi:DNA invertase Pin-like site-specific DNA recombinase
MTRAALYARFSSDLQSAKSVEDQLALLREEAVRRGLVVVGEYRDEAISGASMHGRAGLETLLADAARRKFEIVFSEALDRLSRDQADTAIIFRQLDYLGIGIVTLSEGNVESLHVGFKGVMNAVFLQELARKTRRGLMGRINEGKSAGGRTYGYEPVAGEVRGLLAIVEPEAAIVRRIFADYIAEASARTIAARLNTEGVPGPHGGEWRASTINGQAHAGNGILNNELYVGVRIWNRRRKKKDPLTGRARMFQNPPDVWKRIEVPDLRIIDADTWARVKALQAGRSGIRGAARRPTRLLSGLLQCGTCNGPMAIVGSGGRYGCSAHKEKGTCPNGRTMAASLIEARVIDGLKAALLHPEAQRAAALEFHSEMQRLQKDAGGRKRNLEKDIAELTRRIERAVDAIGEGTAPAALRERLKGMEADRDAKTRELADLTTRNVVALHPKADRLYADMVGKLAEELTADDLDTAEFKTLLRSLVHRIVMTPRVGAIGFDLMVKGDLAALLSQGGRLRGMVGAGTGFGQTPQLAPFQIPA